MLFVDSQVRKVGSISFCFWFDCWNRFSSIFIPNLKLDVPLYIFLKGLSVVFFKGILLVTSNSVSRVPRELINLPVTEDIYGLLSFSFKDKKFNPSIFSRIPKVFQEDVLLSGVLLELGLLLGSGVSLVSQSLAFLNFGVSFSSWRSSFFDTIVYIKINLANSPDEGVLSNPLVFWIKVLIKIAASHSVTVRDALYTKVVNNSFIISRIPPVRLFSSFKVTKTCLNNTTVLLV